MYTDALYELSVLYEFTDIWSGCFGLHHVAEEFVLASIRTVSTGPIDNSKQPSNNNNNKISNNNN